MKRISHFIFLLPVFFLAGISYADFTGKGHVHLISETKQVFLNSDCRSNDSCDLKRFTLTQVANEIWFSDDPKHPTFANGVIMEYETDSLAALEKYAIVQFKQGCVFYSSKNSDGRVHRKVGDTVPSFGELSPFCFPQWVIDSQDSDPAYNSDPEYGRFYLLRWNKPGSYDHRTQKYFGAEKPKTPVLYMTDYPAGAFVTATGARNVALDFKTCIYKSSDVPVETQREDIHFAKPITCLAWQSLYVYDFEKGTFQTQWTNVPRWDEPPMRDDSYQFVIFLTLLLALLLVARPRIGALASPKAGC